VVKYVYIGMSSGVTTGKPDGRAKNKKPEKSGRTLSGLVRLSNLLGRFTLLVINILYCRMISSAIKTKLLCN